MADSPGLHILLTNDDGYDAPGIVMLHRVLREAGHRVSMVAPRGQKSATSMSMTTRETLPVSQVNEDHWHLDGQPVDTILVALRHLLDEETPDLVLSGINYGPNLGIGLHLSGTVGAAAIAAINGVPAIAVSAGMQFHEYEHEPVPFPTTHAVLEPAARFTCDIIRDLHTSRDGDDRLLPHGMMLNVNYPALQPGEIKGVMYPEVSDGHMIELEYSRCKHTDHVVPNYRRNVWELENEEGDIRAHMEGFITISAVRPNWNPPVSEVDAIRSRLNGIDKISDA
jgi:5'-nucleotidase